MGVAFNPRGTSGSGKTTIARAILEESKAEPHFWVKNKVQVYLGELFGCDLVLLGDYRKACGGCDTIQPFADILPLIKHNLDQPRTLLVYEGLMISHSIGSIGELVFPYGNRHVMGFLDTPLELCLERINERRRARGQMSPVNPDNTTKDHRSVANCYHRALRFGLDARIIPHKDAINESFRILHELSELEYSPLLDSGKGEHQDPKGQRGTEAVD